MSYTVYYHGKCEGFYGRAYSILAMLKHAGKEYVMKDPSEVPENAGFAVPIVTFPAGYSLSQTCVIAASVGADCGLAPPSTDAAETAKALQKALDAADLMSNLMDKKPAERINKWLEYVSKTLETESTFMKCGLTYVDFVYHGILEVLTLKIDKGKLEGVKIPDNLVKWHGEFMPKVDGIAKMKATGIPFAPDSFL